MNNIEEPTHPGEILKFDCFEPLGLSVSEAAEWLQMPSRELSDILDKEAGVSPEVALILSEAFGTSAEVWTRLQADHDLWKARQNYQPKGIRPKTVSAN